MKLCHFIFSAILLSSINSHAQNTFPATGNVGIGTTTPVAGLSVEVGPNAAMAPLTSVPNGSAWIGSASTNGGLSLVSSVEHKAISKAGIKDRQAGPINWP